MRKLPAGSPGRLLFLSVFLGTVAACDEAVMAPEGDGTSSTEAAAEPLPSRPVLTASQWTVSDDGTSVDAENETLRLRFAYNAQGTAGFRGGGGRDGSLTELYYKPTSTTRNLAFRSGPYGGKMDGVDYFQAEKAAVDQQDHNTADFASGMNARLVSRSVRESAGRLIVEFEFDFEAWRIARTYIVYPWGDITMHARITQTRAGRWNYLGRRIHFAVGRSAAVDGGTVREWGGNYENDGERFYAWSDGYGEAGSASGTGFYRYEEQIRQGVNRNTVIGHFGRRDHYSGFMIDDGNQNDPDIVVMNGDPSTSASPFDRVARMVGGKAYVETGIFSPVWANLTTHAGVNWFYNTIEPMDYSNPMDWPTSLGTWEESFHVLLRSGLSPDDYLALWQTRVRDAALHPPFDVEGAVVRFDPTDRLYHLRAISGSASVRFKWKREVPATSDLEYRTAFVIEDFDRVPVVRLEGVGVVTAENYRDQSSGDVMVVLSGRQLATAEPFVITLQ